MRELYHTPPSAANHRIYINAGSARGRRKAVGGSGGWKRLRYWARPAGASYTPGRARPPDAPPYLGEAALPPLQIPPTGGSRSCATAIPPGASLIPHHPILRPARVGRKLSTRNRNFTVLARRPHARLRALLLLHRRQSSCLDESHGIISRVTVSMPLHQRGCPCCSPLTVLTTSRRVFHGSTSFSHGRR